MKQWMYLPVLALALSACGGKTQAQKDAEEVCDCLRKSKNSSSLAEKTKCLQLQRTAGEKYLKSPDELKEFNEVLTPCIMETFSH